MATPAQIMPRLDGLLGSGLRTGAAPAAYLRARLWRDLIRTILFSDVLRYATDWELGADQDVIATGANGEIDATGGTVYGILVDSIFDVSGEPLVFMSVDSTDQTLTAEVGVDFGAGEMGTDEEFVVHYIPAASSATAPEIHGWAYPNGILHATNIQLMADGQEGTAVTANDVRAYVIYRSSTEVRV